MKRSFYALFVLLTALSGPLVFTPPAICRQNSAAIETDESALSSLTRTEADQPKCIITLESGPAPEDLVVVPEDFDYEIYNEPNQCEIEQSAALPRRQNDTSPTFPYAQSDIETSLGTNLDNLCLPFVEYGSALEPWVGPAIAGYDSVKSNENCECERTNTEFFAELANMKEVARGQVELWILNSYYEKSYVISSRLRLVFGSALYSSISGMHWAKNAADWRAENIVSSFFGLGMHSFEVAHMRFSELSQTLSGMILTEKQQSLPTPPYCECWARDTETSESMGSSNNESELALDPVAAQEQPGVVEGILPEETAERLDECKITENAEKNDALVQQFGDGETLRFEASPIDFSGLHSVAESFWSAAKGQVEKLERWSKEYEFEPNRNNELRFLSP